MSDKPTANFYCPTCQQLLERLKACGAVDFFCNNCNQLISKRAIITRPEPPPKQDRP